MKSKLLYIFSTLFCLIFFAAGLGAQNVKVDKLTRAGNKEQLRGQYEAADSLYMEALKIDSTSAKTLYNFGNSLYLGDKGQMAHQAWLRSLEKTEETGKADTFYNIGNYFFGEKNYDEAIKHYKDALRRNPADDQARYNLALAKKLKQNQQQNRQQDQGGGGENNEQQQDDKQGEQQNDQNNQGQGEDNKNGEEDKKEGQNKPDENQGGDGQNKDGQEQQNDQGGQQSAGENDTPMEVKQMLGAIEREEEKTKEKMKERQTVGRRQKHEKDW